MAGRYTTYFIYFLPLFFVYTFAELDNAKSLYLKIGMERELICDPTGQSGVIDLKKYKELAVFINSSHTLDSWKYIQFSKRCKFLVKAEKGEGLFAVIQSMHLRRNGSACLDYIKFTKENQETSHKYCGKYSSIKNYFSNHRQKDEDRLYAEESFTDENKVENYEEFTNHGKILTEIFISKQPHSGEPLKLEVVYTPFKDCENIGAYMALSPFRSCINKKLVCDGYFNCASLRCFDENNCTSVVNQIVSDGTGTKVTISAVTTIILCLIIFVLCLWISRKYKKLCWSPDCAGPSATVSGSTSGLPMDRGETRAANLPYVSSAPMLEVAVSPSHHDKDLPPSYDSLFPSQTNAANT